MEPNRSDILEKAGRRDGLTVPEGYFSDFARRMEQMLPETEFEKSPAVQAPAVTPTRWSRIKPYVYMAAMFAGAWCMLKMFSLMSSTDQGAINFDSDPVIAEAIGNYDFIDEYFLDDYTEYDLYQDMVEDGTYEEFIIPDSIND